MRTEFNFGSTREDEADGRAYRVERALGYVSAVTHMSTENIEKYVDSVGDDKGILHVYWRKGREEVSNNYPSRFLKTALEAAWVNENECQIVHTFADGAVEDYCA